MKSIANILPFVSIALAALALSSCSNGSPKDQESANAENSVNKEEISKAKESLKYEAEIANKLLAGKQIDPMTCAVSVDFDGTNLIYTYEIDEEWQTIKATTKAYARPTLHLKSTVKIKSGKGTITNPYVIGL